LNLRFINDCYSTLKKIAEYLPAHLAVRQAISDDKNDPYTIRLQKVIEDVDAAVREIEVLLAPTAETDLVPMMP
jgi:hypothetical protein